MKKELLICLLAFSLPISQLFSQEKNEGQQLPSVTVTSSTNVTAEVKKAFAKAFVNAEQLKWYKMDKDFLAKFILDDMEHNAAFKKNGYMKYDVGFGFERNLPADVLDQVKAKYSKYSVSRVFKVNADNRDIWMMNLDGLKDYVVVRFENGDIDELDSFRKAK